MQAPPSDPFRFIISHLKRCKWWIALQVLVATIWAVLHTVESYSLKLVVDGISAWAPGHSLRMIATPIGYWMLGALCWVASLRVHDLVWLQVKPVIKKALSASLLGKMMEHSQLLYQDQFSGSLSNRVRDVVYYVPELLEYSIDRFWCSFFTILFALAGLWKVDPVFPALVAGWLFLYFTSAWLVHRRVVDLSARAAEATNSVVGYMVDVLSNMVNVRYFAGRREEKRKLNELLDASVQSDRRRDWFFLKLQGCQSLSFLAYEALCLFVLIIRFQNGSISAGSVAFVMNLNVMFATTLADVSEDLNDFSQGVGKVRQGLQAALSKVEGGDRPGATALEVQKGTIVLDNVRFAYKDHPPIFQNLSITIPGGQKVGLVGFSGGGKSTFINLILRIFEVEGGRILIDGQDIGQVTKGSLYKAIGVIPQDPNFFHRTVRENIRYSNPRADEADLLEASKQADVHEVIAHLKNGYDEEVGERGVKLSGGQRQRVAIARGLLKKAPILVLDEATSQLDPLTEMEVNRRVREVAEGCTMLIVAHRLSTLRDLGVERMLVFDKGRIVQDGSHEALVQEEGLYRTLWEAQIGRFCGERLLKS